MKKILIISAVAITIIVIAVLSLTNMFTQGKFTGKLYRVDNVYEEIWNMAISEKDGTQTPLTSSIKGSNISYMLGFFEQINIPVNDEYGIILSFNNNELCMHLHEYNNKKIDGREACFVYNHQSNTLYGNRKESHLIDRFTSLYFSWVGNDGKFNPYNQGNYTYVYTEFPLTHN